MYDKVCKRRGKTKYVFCCFPDQLSQIIVQYLVYAEPGLTPQHLLQLGIDVHSSQSLLPGQLRVLHLFLIHLPLPLSSPTYLNTLVC
jgi:hypothetical protein